jgi:hypothetical protein
LDRLFVLATATEELEVDFVLTRCRGVGEFATVAAREAEAAFTLFGLPESSETFRCPLTTAISSLPPTALTYWSRTSIVTLRDRSMAAMRG